MYYTSIEQSRKLIEAGLNPNTADMSWIAPRRAHITDCPETPIIMDIYLESIIPKDKRTPCWTTGALIDLLPFEIHIAGNKNLLYQLRFGKAETEFWITYESPIADLKGSFIGFNTVIDKCDMTCCIYKMVLWCLENGYIKKGE